MAKMVIKETFAGYTEKDSTPIEGEVVPSPISEVHEISDLPQSVLEAAKEAKGISPVLLSFIDDALAVLSQRGKTAAATAMDKYAEFRNLPPQLQSPDEEDETELALAKQAKYQEIIEVTVSLEMLNYGEFVELRAPFVKPALDILQGEISQLNGSVEI